MSKALVESAVDRNEGASEFHTFGITSATVIDNEDLTTQGRVQVSIKWLPDVNPWVRVAVPTSGNDRGTYFMPQQDDEVLVAFAQADFREAYVIGSVWNKQDKPPATDKGDPTNKRLVLSPKGLEILLDDTKTAITITIKPPKKVEGEDQEDKDKKDVVPVIVVDKKSITLKRVTGDTEDDEQQKIILSDDGISLEAKKGDIVLKTDKGKLKINAKSIEIESKEDTQMKASKNCVIKGQQIQLN